MTAVNLSPIGNETLFSPTTGLIANGYKLFFYQANTTTKQNTYTTQAGSVANSNPITLDSYGKVPSAGQIWLSQGLRYKVVLAPPTDTDPPVSGVVLADYVTGINDYFFATAQDQWAASGLTPTYISATSFSVTGDQTSALHIGRRVKTTNTGGTIYSTITNSVYGSVTTVTVENDSGTLDSGLSAVSYGILTSTNPSVPKILLPDGSAAVTQASNNSTTKIATTAYVDLSSSYERQDFRLSLTTSVPITTSDVALGTTIYAVPYIGNKIGLYNGTTWDVLSSSEFSLALGTLTASRGYDVFCYNNAGVATLEFLVWTSANARATALVYQDGILCKSGQLTRRYMGSFYTLSTTQTSDTSVNSAAATGGRYLWNYYHRMKKPVYIKDSTGAASGASAGVYRQARGSGANQSNFFVGLVEDAVYATLSTRCECSNIARMECSIGFNSITVVGGGNDGIGYANASTINTEFELFASIYDYPVLGLNYLSWLEKTTATSMTVTYANTYGLRGYVSC